MLSYRPDELFDENGRLIDEYSDFFFFQAEDGIRDLTVTGVQTCALPIFEARLELARGRPAYEFVWQINACLLVQVELVSHLHDSVEAHLEAEAVEVCVAGEIGRASCRGRV